MELLFWFILYFMWGEIRQIKNSVSLLIFKVAVTRASVW